MTKKNLPYVIQYNSDFYGCGFWRLLWPQFVLNMTGKAAVHHSHLFIRDFLHYSRASVIHIQRQSKYTQYNFYSKLSSMKDRLKFRLVYDVDDIIFFEDVPIYNSAKKEISSIEMRESSQKIMELCDEMTVSTPFLREYYLQKTSQKNITVIPNYIPLFWMGNYYSEELILNKYRKHKQRPRILYAGSGSHFDVGMKTKDFHDDFYHIRDAVIRTKDEFKWVFVGAFPPTLVALLQAGDIEYHPWVDLEKYPRFLMSLNCNMAIAPLMESDFNRAKSDIKFLEASALGMPIACQDLCTYAVAPIRFKAGDDLIHKIRETLKSEESLIEACREGRKRIDKRWLELDENIGKHLDVYTYPYGDPQRKYLS